MISGSTKVYTVIGNPITHSKSPNMHNAAFQKLNIDACYVPFWHLIQVRLKIYAT